MKAKTLVTASLSLGALCLAPARPAKGESALFQRTLIVTLKDPVTLNVSLAKGTVMIAYNREGRVSVYASGRDPDGKPLPKEFFDSALHIEQTENGIIIQDSPGPGHHEAISVSYKIDVPYRTEVSSFVSNGNQIIMGITGPARAIAGIGDIDASYIRSGLLSAETGRGNISCARVTWAQVETGSGNITLMESGPSTATVKQGAGRIEVGGARGVVRASTASGELHIKAVPWDNWELRTKAGNIRVEVPQDAEFQADIATKSGVISVDRADMAKIDAYAHEYRQSVNGGGKRIQARTKTGNISIE